MSSAKSIRAMYLLVAAFFLFPSVARALDASTSERLPPEHTDIRSEFLDYVSSPLVELFRLREATRRSRISGVDVRVSVDESPEFVYLVIVPERDGEFPLDTAGTYILRRRRDNGTISQLKIFLRSDPRFFVRVRPDREGRSLMSVYLADTLIHQDVPVPMGMETIMQAPLEQLLDVTSSMVDWSWFFPELSVAAYGPVELMAERARATLHTLPDAEDGAMDESGRLVFIESLVLQDQEPGFNCSGFAKWIVDGLHMGLYGSFLPIEPLKTKHTELRGHRWSEPLEDDRDPYFGLDWTRNLATAMLSAEHGDAQAHPESADVRSVPYSTYIEDVGYPVDQLTQVMYLLAIEEPGYFYVASVNREFGSDPRLNQHVHVAVLFPYFDHDEGFHVDVLERNVETSLQSLDNRYHDDNIHLVRIRADESYTPPLIRN
jgi:hypothetical protein